MKCIIINRDCQAAFWRKLGNSHKSFHSWLTGKFSDGLWDRPLTSDPRWPVDGIIWTTTGSHFVGKTHAIRSIRWPRSLISNPNSVVSKWEHKSEMWPGVKCVVPYTLSTWKYGLCSHITLARVTMETVIKFNKRPPTPNQPRDLNKTPASVIGNFISLGHQCL